MTRKKWIVSIVVSRGLKKFIREISNQEIENMEGKVRETSEDIDDNKIQVIPTRKQDKTRYVIVHFENQIGQGSILLPKV